MDETLRDAPIVVGIDGSVTSYAAVSWAAREAEHHRCGLHVVTALDTPAVDGVRLPPTYFTDRDRAARTYLAEAVALARSALAAADHTALTSEILHGPVRPALIEASASARMIILGSRGLSRITTVLAGSTTTALAAHAHCPVVVIRDQAGHRTGNGTVAVGVDGSPHGEAALAVAYAEAALRGADLLAIHTWTPFVLATAFDDRLDLPWDEVAVAEAAVLAESLAGWQDRYPEVTVTPTVVRGHPAEELGERAADCDLLVVGGRGRGGFAGMLLGSTSAALLHLATCPLMIVAVSADRSTRCDAP